MFCNWCGGSEELDSQCRFCKGFGRHQCYRCSPQGFNGGRNEWGLRCGDCDGRGEQVCQDCLGTGRVKVRCAYCDPSHPNNPENVRKRETARLAYAKEQERIWKEQQPQREEAERKKRAAEAAAREQDRLATLAAIEKDRRDNEEAARRIAEKVRIMDERWRQQEEERRREAARKRNRVGVLTALIVIVLGAIFTISVVLHRKEQAHSAGERRVRAWREDTTGTVPPPRLGDPVPVDLQKVSAPAAVATSEPTPSASTAPIPTDVAPTVASITQEAGALSTEEVAARVRSGVGVLDESEEARAFMQKKYGVTVTSVGFEGLQGFGYVEGRNIYLFDAESLTFRLFTLR